MRFSSIIALFFLFNPCFAQITERAPENVPKYSFECFCGFLTTDDCGDCTDGFNARYFDGMIIRKNGEDVAYLSRPFIIRQKGETIEIIDKSINFKISINHTDYSSIEELKSVLSSCCAIQGSNNASETNVIVSSLPNRPEISNTIDQNLTPFPSNIPQAALVGGQILKVEQSMVYDSVQIIWQRDNGTDMDTFYFPDNHNIFHQSSPVINLRASAYSDTAYMGNIAFWNDYDGHLMGRMGFNSIMDEKLSIQNNSIYGGVEINTGGVPAAYWDYAGRPFFYNLQNLSDSTLLGNLVAMPNGRIGYGASSGTGSGTGGASTVWHEQGTSNAAMDIHHGISRMGSLVLGDTSLIPTSNTALSIVSPNSTRLNPSMGVYSPNSVEVFTQMGNRTDSMSISFNKNFLRYNNDQGKAIYIFDLAAPQKTFTINKFGSWFSEAPIYTSPGNSSAVNGWASFVPFNGANTKSRLMQLGWSSFPTEALNYSNVPEYNSQTDAANDPALSVGSPYTLACPNVDNLPCTLLHVKK